MRDGHREPYHTEPQQQRHPHLHRRRQHLLSPGTYTYTLRYTTGRQIRFLSDHTELFWNVTGNEWSFPILAATARITLPDGRAPVRWTAYTGRFGERGQDFTGQILGDNTLEVKTTARLAPREGLSVAVQIPDGLVAAAERQPGRSSTGSSTTGASCFGGLGFLGVLGFYLVTWNAVGRDPPKGTIIPLFHPPEGVSPALAGYIDNWGWSEGGWRNFTAATRLAGGQGAAGLRRFRVGSSC